MSTTTQVPAAHSVRPRQPAPLPESQKIAALIPPRNEKVDIYLDGALQQRPCTRFS